MDIDSFLVSRKPHRPYTRPTATLANKVGLTSSVVYEVSWGLYETVPQVLRPYVDQEYYQAYRTETRQLFGEYFTLPKFLGFQNLANTLDTTFQGLAKCLCVQRALLQRWDKTQTQCTEIDNAWNDIDPEYYTHFKQQEILLKKNLLPQQQLIEDGDIISRPTATNQGGENNS